MECFKAEQKFEGIYKASPVSTESHLSPPNPETFRMYRQTHTFFCQLPSNFWKPCALVE